MTKRKLVTIRLSQEQYDLLRKLSDDYGMTMQDFIITKTLTYKDIKKINDDKSDLVKAMKRQEEMGGELKFIRQALYDLSKLMEKRDERTV